MHNVYKRKNLIYKINLPILFYILVGNFEITILYF